MSSLFEQTTEVVQNPRVIFIACAVLALVVCIVILWYFWPRGRDTTVMGPFDLTMKPNPASVVSVFTQSQLLKSFGNNFTLGFFVYMDAINESRIPFAGSEGDYRFKPFVNILGVGSLFVDPIHQEVRFSVNTTAPEFGKKSDITVQSFAIARWNQVVITIEGRSVDMYVNGQLRASELLSNIPTWAPTGVLLETSPDFSGQAGLFQAWPQRRTESEILKNYKRNTDTRGKPLIPDKEPTWDEIFKHLKIDLCKYGFCHTPKLPKNPIEYVDYEYA